MKLLNKLSAAMLSVALMAGFASCTEKAEYEAPSIPDNAQVYFSNTEATTVALNFEQDSFAVKVYREVAGEELVVDLNIVSDSANIFTYPESVVFEADSTVAYIPVTFDFANILPDTDYPISVELLGDQITPYGASTVNLVVKYAPWSEWEKFATAQNELAIYWAGTLSDIVVYKRESLLDPTKMQFAFENYPGYEMIIDYDVTTGLCHVGVTDINYTNDTYGAMYIADSETYGELVPRFLEKEEVKPSTFDQETGLFSLHLVYFVSAGWFGAGYEYLQLDGYTQPDYSLTIENKGHYITTAEVDNALIYIHKGADVDTYKYVLEMGALDNAQLNEVVGAIVADTIESTEVAESGYQLFPLTEAGEYTIVAVAFDKTGVAQSANYLTFEFAPAGQASPWESLGMATYREDFVAGLFGIENVVYEVEIQANTETPGLYRLVNPYGAAYPYNEEGDYDASKNYYVVIDAQDPTAVSIQNTSVGMNWGYGEFSVWSLADYNLANGATKEQVAEAGMFGTLENGVITFPVKTLLVSMAEYQNGAIMYANTNGKFAVALPGYTIPEDEATEEGGEESSVRARRIVNAQSFGKYTIKGRPANADEITKHLQSNLQ